MSTCQTFPTKTKAQAIEGFCDEFPGFCSVSATKVESVPTDVEESILFDTKLENDKKINNCDGGFNSDLSCPSACGQPQTTVTATYKVVADAFGGGEECPYHHDFVMNRTCPATPACPADCKGGSWRYTCPSYCGYEGGYTTKVWAGATPAVGDGKACPSPTMQYCPAITCPMKCVGTWSAWSGCPSCGTTSTSHSRKQTWTTTSTLPSGYYYSPVCPTTKTENCPATPACPADCSGGSWSHTCPTQCGYGGGNVTATLTGYTPAVGTGSCTTTKNVWCPATQLCTTELSYFKSLFTEWGNFVVKNSVTYDPATYGLVTPKTSQKSMPLLSYYDPYPNLIQGFRYAGTTNGMGSNYTSNFYFKEPSGKLIRDVTCSILWKAEAYSDGNIIPIKYRIYSKLYGSTDWTLRGDYDVGSSAGVDVTTTWTVSEPSHDYRMEVYDWYRASKSGSYYYISRDSSTVSYYDTYYDVALSGYDGYVVVSGITISLRGMGIRYDDVETIVSFEIRGLNKSGEDVVVYSETSNESRNFSASINSSTIVKGVYVRLKLGRSTGRGDYMGETHDLSIKVQAVKQI
jgi:hypothetical protein